MNVFLALKVCRQQREIVERGSKEGGRDGRKTEGKGRRDFDL